MPKKKTTTRGTKYSKDAWNKAKTKKWRISYTVIEAREAKPKKGQSAKSAGNATTKKAPSKSKKAPSKSKKAPRQTSKTLQKKSKATKTTRGNAGNKSAMRPSRKTK